MRQVSKKTLVKFYLENIQERRKKFEAFKASE